jgi:predicted phosphodiesterase
VRAANGDTADFVQRLQADFTAQLPRILGWLVAELLLGVLAGLAAAAAVNMALGYLRGRPRRERELRHRLLQLGAAGLVLLGVAGYGAATYNPHWLRQSRLTGTLAAAQLFPDQLSRYYQQQSKAFDVLGSVIGVQAALQQRIDADRTPAAALQVMVISDMHLAANYPLVAQYVRSYGVDLILDTGDEAEFGTRLELTPGYLDALRAVTATTPMLWLAGNHDSPDVVATMRGIPGVTVLGTKTSTGDGYAVTAGQVRAYGLTIAGVSDPRVYGGGGAYGADDPKVTEPLERAAVDAAVPAEEAPQGGTAAPGSIDVFATHEPVAAAELRERLPGRIRQTVAGHTHAQNDPAELQDGDGIDLVEGSVGAGGLDNIVRGDRRPPVEFSIESVAADCQFTRIIRFQLRPSSAAGGTPADAAAFGDDVTASTIYFRPQQVAPGRTCGTGQGISAGTPR